MGRKRKTRWRRLSIGEISANEEEEMDGLAGGIQMSLKLTDDQGDDNNVCLVGGKMVNGKLGDQIHPHRPSSGSSPSTMTTPTNNTSSTASSVDSQPTGNHHHHHNNHHHYNSSNHPSSSSHYNSRYNNHHGTYHHQPHHHYSQSNQHYSSSGKPSESNYHNGHYSNYYQGGRNNYNNYRNNPHHYSSHNGGGSGGGGGGAPNSTASSTSTNNGANNGETSSNSSTTNPPTQATSTASNGSGSTGGGNYHYSNSSYRGGGGRFRKPRPYGSYYYQNGGQAGQGQNGEGPNRPSYNQDEYTKITTPRQDVLFKKGYLSQRKSQSVESNSATTTPSASTNGTPDTQSTNGVHSDYSEGYENGETDCGVPYDDTVYYGPSDPAVFTDPHTGQVFYGHCSPGGEYFDAYPVMVAGYPAPVYYHMPYQPMDWNGMPAPMYPVIAAPVPMEEHLLPQNYKGVEPMEVPPTSIGGGNTTVNPGAESGKTEPDGGGASTTSKDPNNSAPVTSTDEANNGSSNSGTTTTAHSDTTTTSVPAVLPPPPIAHSAVVPHMGMPLPPGGHPGHLQPHHHPLAHHIPPGAAGPGSGYIPAAASTHHGTNHGMPALHPQHHLNSVPGPFIYPHPAGFVYGPPIFHGVVHVPFGGGAVSSLEISSSNSRKKRKKKRRKKDGQLTDEGSDETASISNPDEDPQAVEYEERESELLPEEEELYPQTSDSSFLPAMEEEINKQITTHVSSSLSSSSASLSVDKEDSMNENSSENSDETLVAKNILKQNTTTPPLSPPKNSKQDSATKSNNNTSADNIDDETPSDSTTEILIVRSDSESDKTVEGNSQIELTPQTTVDDEDKKDDEKEEQESPPTTTSDDTVVEPDPVPEEVVAATASTSSEDCNNPETDKNSNPPSSEAPPTETPILASNTAQEQPAAAAIIDTPVTIDNETCPNPPEPLQVEEEELTDDIVALIASSTNRRSMNKPVDLTLLPPASDSNDLHLLQLQRSPDGFANEPSSPDSFNTNQSVAGSEVAVGDTLSFSETDHLNRTTSIDEVEEDLPHEGYYGSYENCCLNSIALPNSSSIQFVSVDSSPVITSVTAFAEEFSASDQSSSLPLDNDLSELLEPEEEASIAPNDSSIAPDIPNPDTIIDTNNSDNANPDGATPDNASKVDATSAEILEGTKPEDEANEAKAREIPDEKDFGNHVTDDSLTLDPLVNTQKEPEQTPQLSTDQVAITVTTSPSQPPVELENESLAKNEPEQMEDVTTPAEEVTTPVQETTSPVEEVTTKTSVEEATTSTPIVEVTPTTPVVEVTPTTPVEEATPTAIVEELPGTTPVEEVMTKTFVAEVTATAEEVLTPVSEVTTIVTETPTPAPEPPKSVTEEIPERPKSITLAVSEWLKTQGDDALTPVISSDDNELTQEEEDEEGDGDDEDEEDDGGGGEKSRRTSENGAVGGGGPNQKNVHGNPWAVPSNKSVAGKRSRLLLTSRRVYQVSGFKGYRVLASKKTIKSPEDAASQDGNDPRVAPSSTSSATTSADSIATKSTTPNSKPPNLPITTSSKSNKQDKNPALTKDKKLKNQKLQNYDSGLELSSPENGDKKLDQSAEVAPPEPQNLSQNNEPLDALEPSVTKDKDYLTSSEASPARLTPASIPEELSEDIYNPRNFSKYYQFGVVFDDDASSVKTADLNDLDPISLDLDDAPTTTTTDPTTDLTSPNDDLSICSNEDEDDQGIITPSYYSSLKPSRNDVKVDGQSMFSTLPGNKDTLNFTLNDNATSITPSSNKHISTCEGIEMKNDLNNVITSATTITPEGITKDLSSCDANKIDLEIGAAFLKSSTTLDPKNINLHGTTSNPVASVDQPSTTSPQTTHLSPTLAESKELSLKNAINPSPATRTPKPNTLYINPMSLAVEMDFEDHEPRDKIAGSNDKKRKTVPASVEDEEIPEYVSPEIDYPVFNHLQGTAPAKLIRNRLESVTGTSGGGGQNIPCAICCVVQ